MVDQSKKRLGSAEVWITLAAGVLGVVQGALDFSTPCGKLGAVVGLLGVWQGVRALKSRKGE